MFSGLLGIMERRGPLAAFGAALRGWGALGGLLLALRLPGRRRGRSGMPCVRVSRCDVGRGTLARARRGAARPATHGGDATSPPDDSEKRELLAVESGSARTALPPPPTRAAAPSRSSSPAARVLLYVTVNSAMPVARTRCDTTRVSPPAKMNSAAGRPCARCFRAPG